MIRLTRKRGVLAAVAAMLVSQTALSGQTDADGTLVDALQCWRRVDRQMITVGQPFEMTVTCRIVESDQGRAVPEMVALEPQALDVAPFEIVDGERFDDVLDGAFRLFQYRYSLRLITDESFGRDVELPALEITYRIERQLDDGSVLPGRELVYILAPEIVRVLALVPDGMSDIHSLPLATLGDAADRKFWADLTLGLAGALGLLALGVLVVGLVKARRDESAVTTAARRPVAKAAVIRAILDELSSVQEISQTAGWTPVLTGRALAALRLVAAIATGSTVSERDAPAPTPPREGELVVHSGRVRPRTTIVSASVTPRDITAESLRPLRDALTDLSTWRYAPPGEAPDQVLTRSLERGIALTHPLRVRTLKPVHALSEWIEAARRWWQQR